MGSIEAELLRGWAPVMLIVIRSWAIFRAQVLWRTMVGGLWWLIAVPLAVATAPLGLTAPLPGSTSMLLWLALAEVALGTAIGFMVSLPGYALVGAASVQAKILRTAPGAWVGLVVALVGSFALLSGAHRPLLTALSELHDLFEVGAPGAWLVLAQQEGLGWLVRGLHAMLVLALAFATPVLLTAAVVESGLGLATAGEGPSASPVRAMQAWLRVAAALVALGAAWASFPAVWGSLAVTPVL